MSSSNVQSFSIAGVLVLMAVLLFARLGHYALWDDESFTALEAKGVMRTGDTSVLMDYGNIQAYRGGINILGFCDRQNPPLPTYLTAASFSLLGVNAWAGRLPFALFGLATTALILFWARQESGLVLAVLAIGLVGNVSLILYSRQCRYYALAVFLSTVIVFIYWRWKPTPPTFLVLAGFSSLLFACHYLDYVALYVCLAADYIFWKRKEWPLTWRNAVLLFAPQLVPNGIVASIWNPLATQFAGYEAMNSLADRATLFVWYWRDANRCEFFALPLLLLALGVGVMQRRTWLVRGCVAVALYITVIAAISPQPVGATSSADVRYLAPIIPLAIAMEAGAICVLLARHPALAVAAALVVFGTNLCNGGPRLGPGLRSTLFSYIGELLHPPTEPYTPTAKWINENVPEGKSIWVLPGYAAYPLMFHAPRAVYAWQLAWPPRFDFAQLAPINFQGRQAPDYLVAFGPALSEMERTLQSWNRPDVQYKPVATIDVFWKDAYRPELMWRTFAPITGYDQKTQAIHVFKRVSP
jgi:hypothetical protein